MYDLIIRNALIADGLGNPLIEGDLAVKDGRVAAIGRIEGNALDTLDAEGHVLAPGVIDIHTHYDAQLTWDKTASPSPALGVTTVVVGNCGFGVAPAPEEHRDSILANLAEVEAMSLESLRAGIDTNYETFGEYMSLLEEKGTYPNVAVLASHAVMRTAVMGDAGSQRAATDDELEQMLGLFREAMDAGAVGLGSSSNENHRGAGGIPIASRFSKDDEYRSFAKVLSEYDHGVFMATFGEMHGIPFVEEMSEISGRPGCYAANFYHPRQPERGVRIMKEAEAARQRGLPVFTQGSCQPLSLSFYLDGAYALKTYSIWPTTEDQDELRTIFSDTSFRDDFRDAIKDFDSARLFTGRWEWVIVAVAGLDKNKDLEGKSVLEIALERDVDPLDLFLDLALEEDFKTKYAFYLLNMEDDGVAEIIGNDGTLISLSDAGAHNSMLCDAGYAMHLFGYWSREKGLFDLPTAIRKVTHDPADVYGIIDRGQLTVGAWADMILFDPDTISITKMTQHFELPADGDRLLRQATGLLGTWINGTQVFDGNDYVDVVAPGHILRKFSGEPPKLGMGQ